MLMFMDGQMTSNIQTKQGQLKGKKISGLSHKYAKIFHFGHLF